VDRVAAAADCGVAVNPDVIRAQVEDGVGYDLGAALRNKITLTADVVDPSNFDGYESLRISDMPSVDGAHHQDVNCPILTESAPFRWRDAEPRGGGDDTQAKVVRGRGPSHGRGNRVTVVRARAHLGRVESEILNFARMRES